ARPDAVADRQRAAADFARRYASYSEIRIQRVDYRGLEAADWEFTYTAGGVDLHVVNRVFVAGDRGYSLYFQTRAGDWPQARQDFERIAASFRPAAA
ncbi:MAG: serine/threonine protein kinase, partial [Actinomycetota bacterium]|nr:serine/threonine protein kinase [Actinomycetota bacterium]